MYGFRIICTETIGHDRTAYQPGEVLYDADIEDYCPDADLAEDYAEEVRYKLADESPWREKALLTAQIEVYRI